MILERKIPLENAYMLDDYGLSIGGRRGSCIGGLSSRFTKVHVGKGR